MHVVCDSCHSPITLTCEGLGGTTMYETHNEFICPHCGKQNHARTPGAILSAGAGPAKA